MTIAAFLPEIAAGAVALFAASAGNSLRAPSLRRNRRSNECADAEQKAVAWSYDPSSDKQNPWRPVMRHGSC